METERRHRCLIYQGSPSRNLPGLAALTRRKLKDNFRCLYLDSPPMVAGMRSYLAAQGVDVAYESGKTSLVLTSEQGHLLDGSFDVDRMIQALADALEQALKDGYAGLWATGDMMWEFGPNKDFSKLLEYEWRLEEFIREHPSFSGICQYHIDTLPREAQVRGLLTHQSIFINETLSRINHEYVAPEAYTELSELNPELDEAIYRLCHEEPS